MALPGKNGPGEQGSRSPDKERETHLESRFRVLVLAKEAKALEFVVAAGGLEVGAQIAVIAQLAAFVPVQKGQERAGHLRGAENEVAWGGGEVGRVPVDFELGLALGGAVDAEGEFDNVPGDGAWRGAVLGCSARGGRGRDGGQESEESEDGWG